MKTEVATNVAILLSMSHPNELSALLRMFRPLLFTHCIPLTVAKCNNLEYLIVFFNRTCGVIINNKRSVYFILCLNVKFKCRVGHIQLSGNGITKFGVYQFLLQCCDRLLLRIMFYYRPNASLWRIHGVENFNVCLYFSCCFFG